MRGDRCCQFIRLGHLVFRVIARVPQPSHIEVVIPGGDLLTSEETKPTLFSVVLPVCLSEWVFPERSLKRLEVGDCERLGLAEGVHIGTHVIEPYALGVALVGLSSREKQNIGLNTLRVEDPGREPQNCVKVAKLHHPVPQTATYTIFEEDIIGNHDSGASSRLHRSDNVLNEGELFIGGVCRDRKIVPRRPPSPLFRSEGWVRQNEISFADPFTIRG